VDRLTNLREAIASASGEHQDVLVTVDSGRVCVTTQYQDVLPRILGSRTVCGNCAVKRFTTTSALANVVHIAIVLRYAFPKWPIAACRTTSRA
jgi:hypothetical protein